MTQPTTNNQTEPQVKRYKSIWAGGPSTDELRRQFTQMDPQTLDLALDQLANRLDFPPTIAQIRREYAAVKPRDYGYDRPEDTGPPISLDDYLNRHHDDALERTRQRHPSTP